MYSPELVRLQRLRIFLIVLAAGLFAGTIVELFAVKHYGSTLQLLPFALCVAGLIGMGIVWLVPARNAIRGVRAAMVAIALSCLIGVWEHIQGNLEFAREVHRHATTRQLIEAAFHGRNPLIAPGTLAVAAALAVAATYARVPATETVSVEQRAPKRSIGVRRSIAD